MNDHVEVSPAPGDRVRLLFASSYVKGLQPNWRGTVAAVEGSGTIHMMWDNGEEQELRTSENPYRLLVKAFQGGKLVMELLDDKSKAAGMPKPEDRVQFLASTLPSRGLWLGNKGTVDSVDKRGVVSVSWDNGAEVDLVPGWDTYRILPKDERGDIGGCNSG